MAAINALQVQINADDRILRRRQVEARTGLPRSTLYAKIAAGKFPKQIQLGAKSVGWLESEVSAWLTQQIEGSRKSALAA